MLVYIRESDLNHVMRPLPDLQIPQHLTTRFTKEAEERERELQEKSEAHKFTHVYVALDYHVAKFDKFALRTDFVSINSY